MTREVGSPDFYVKQSDVVVVTRRCYNTLRTQIEPLVDVRVGPD